MRPGLCRNMRTFQLECDLSNSSPVRHTCLSQACCLDVVDLETLKRSFPVCFQPFKQLFFSFVSFCMIPYQGKSTIWLKPKMFSSVASDVSHPVWQKDLLTFVILTQLRN